MDGSKDFRRRTRSQGRPRYADHHHRPDITCQILPKMIAYINSRSSGCIHLKDLQKSFDLFSFDQLWSFVRENSSNFLVELESGHQDWNLPSKNAVIWVKTDLRLCETHCRKGQHCLGECGQLHLCRTFLLLGSQCCPFQKSSVCAFGHNLKTNHNSNLLDAHNLVNLSENELRALFRRRICRSVSTMPQICIYYNGKGCSNKKCKSLHLCLDYVLDKCQEKCTKNHSMSSEQVAYTLDLFAIDKSWPNNSVLEDLRSIMRKRIRHSSDVSSVVSEDSTDHDDTEDDSDGEMNGYATASSQRKSTSHRVVKCCSHCEETRAEMIKMREKMEDLQEQLISLKASSGRNRSVEANDSELECQFSLGERQMLADQLFPIVNKMQPELAEQITKMILDMKKVQLKQILTSQEALKTKIEEAAGLLNIFHDLKL